MPVSPAEDSALRALYEQHAAPLLAYAVRLTGGDRGRAEDILQETLLRAWRHPQALDPERGPVRSWLFTVARNVAVDAHRARRARPTEVGDGAPPAVPPAAGSAQPPTRGPSGAAPPPRPPVHRPGPAGSTRPGAGEGASRSSPPSTRSTRPSTVGSSVTHSPPCRRIIAPCSSRSTTADGRSPRRPPPSVSHRGPSSRARSTRCARY